MMQSHTFVVVVFVLRRPILCVFLMFPLIHSVFIQIQIVICCINIKTHMQGGSQRSVEHSFSQLFYIFIDFFSFFLNSLHFRLDVIKMHFFVGRFDVQHSYGNCKPRNAFSESTNENNNTRIEDIRRAFVCILYRFNGSNSNDSNNNNSTSKFNGFVLSSFFMADIVPFNLLFIINFGARYCIVRYHSHSHRNCILFSNHKNVIYC